MRTILLTDIVGSTALWERDQAAMGDAVATHERLIRHAVATHGGEVVKAKGEGDSTFSVFDRATDAVAAALDLQLALRRAQWLPSVAIQVRAALHTGEMQHRAGDYYGRAVNRAARLRELGKGGTVVLSETTAALVVDDLPEAAALISLGEHALRGLDRPERAHALTHPDLPDPQTVAPAGHGARPDLPEPLRARTALVGRATELAVLRRWATGHDSSPFLVVTGQAGAGKTRLVVELAAELHATGTTVLCGRCPRDPLAPFQPITELLAPLVERGVVPPGRASMQLARWFPDLGSPHDAEPRQPDDADRLALFEAVGQVLAAAGDHVLVVIDDLHWTDAPTVRLLEHLMAHLPPGLRVIATLRDTDEGRSRPLAGLWRSAPEHLTVGALDVETVQALLGDVPRDLANRVHSDAGGNALFVSLLGRHLRETGELEGAAAALDVHAVVHERLSTLPSATGELLTAAAVSGHDFELAVVADAAGIDEDEAAAILAAAEHAGLIDEVRDQAEWFRFTHAIVARALGDGVPASTRTRLHRRLGEAIERRPDADRRLSELARHFAAAAPLGYGDRALTYARRAAEEAFDAAGFEEAARHLDVALRLLDASGHPEPAERAGLLSRLGDIQLRVGDPQASSRVFADALVSARATRDPELLAETVLGAVAFSVRFGRARQEEDELFDEALAALGPTDRPLRARLLARRATWAGMFDVEAFEGGLEAFAMAKRLGDDGLMALTVADSVASTIWAVERSDVEAIIPAMWRAIAQSPGSLPVEARQTLCFFALSIGRADVARRSVASQRDIADRSGSFRHHASALALESAIAILDGRLEDAQANGNALLEVAARFDRNVEMMMSSWSALILEVRWLEGRLAEQIPIIEGFITAQDGGYPSWWAGAALAHAEAGDEDGARRELARLVGLGDSLPRRPDWPAVVTLVGRACARIGDSETAAAVLELARPLAGRCSTLFAFLFFGSCDHDLGLLAAAAGRAEEAVQLIEQGLATLDAMEARPFAALARSDLADALIDRDGPGDRDRAVELLDGVEPLAAEQGWGAITQRAARVRLRVL